jgi:acetyl esterase/lipase
MLEFRGAATDNRARTPSSEIEGEFMLLRFTLIVTLCGLPMNLARLVAAEPSETVFLWPNGAPHEPQNSPPEGTEPQREGDTTIRIKDVSSPTLAVYRPAKEKDCGAAVVICPGGGYRILAYNKEGTEVAEWLNTLGVTGIVLKYRVPVREGRERFDAPLEDAQRALGVVRHRASEWGIDPQRIGILGFSAGGHLAATASNQFAKRTYEPIDAADAVSCKPDFAVLIYPAYLVDKQTLKTSPEVTPSTATPQTFIAMTEDDGVGVEGALMYYLGLKQNKVSGEMHLYPVGGHGYGLRPSDKLVSTWPARAADWLRSRGLLEKK